MRTGVEPGVVAEPTGEIVDIDGMPAQLTRIRAERPAHIPAGPPRVPQGFEFEAPRAPLPQGTLQYDFPLLPAVQCRVIFQGDVTADHLEQLSDYLGVACKRLREQEARKAATPKVAANGSEPMKKSQRRTKERASGDQS
jgi:hypothetical protein